MRPSSRSTVKLKGHVITIDGNRFISTPAVTVKVKGKTVHIPARTVRLPATTVVKGKTVPVKVDVNRTVSVPVTVSVPTTDTQTTTSAQHGDDGADRRSDRHRADHDGERAPDHHHPAGADGDGDCDDVEGNPPAVGGGAYDPERHAER